MDQEYTIVEVKEITQAKFGQRVRMELEGVGLVTTFTKWVDKLTPGAKVFGRVSDSQYGKDFKFASRTNYTPPNAPQSPQSDGSARVVNMIEFKVLPVLDRLVARQTLIMKALGLKVEDEKIEYPKMTEENDAGAFDAPEITKEDIPF